MFSAYLGFFVFYAIAFVIAQCMPGRRSLLAFAGLPVGAVICLIVMVYAADARDAHLDVVALWITAFLTGSGVLAGVVTRAVVLYLRPLRLGWFAPLLTLCAGFLFLPALGAALYQWYQWQERLPPAQCLGSKQRVQLGRSTFHLPAAPLFSIATDISTSVYFHSNRPLREFCELGQKTRAPVHAVRLDIAPYNLTVTYNPLQQAFCRAPRSRWGRELCSQDAALVESRYFRGAALHAPTESYFSQLVNGSGTYTDFMARKKKAESLQAVLPPLKSGIFDHHPDGYRVVRDGSWKNDAGEPFTLFCYDTSTAGVISCSTIYRLRSGLAVSYDFQAVAANLEAAARTVDANFHAMLDDLLTE
jgi:hypothetical protein